MTEAMMDMDTIMAGLDDQVRTNILILDACRNNPMAPKLASAGPARDIEAGSGWPRRHARGRLDPGCGHADRIRNRARTGRARRRRRQQPVLGRADPPYRHAGLEVQQMLTRVRAEVVAATKGKQVPWSNSSLLGEVIWRRSEGDASYASSHALRNEGAVRLMKIASSIVIPSPRNSTTKPSSSTMRTFFPARARDDRPAGSRASAQGGLRYPA
jgi:hypothetical protein